MLDPVKDYLKKVEKELQSGNTTEHSHRPHLKSLIESFDKSKSILAINEPKRVNCGAPDYIVVRNHTPLGYIEAKDVGIPLAKEEKGEQMTRYRSSLSNLILTDYLEFRWYVKGEHRLTVRIGEASLNQVKADGDGIKKFLEMVAAFLTVQVPTVSSPKELAQRMAALARLVRETIQRALNDEDKGGTLRYQMEGFREVLLHDLTEEQFADMYAQSICYGLFAARCNSDPSVRFTREHAAYDLPKTNPFLRTMFSYIAGSELDDRVVWVVDDLAELLHHSDMSLILQDFGKRTRQEDPVVHFYETFLSIYDRKMREMRGVYYTPEPVVSYIVRSVDQILKRDFGLKEGLANASKISAETPSEKKKGEFHKVQILDPACGTGTFLHGVVDQIQESFGGNEGMWSGYVSEHLLPRLWGFELLMAPYAVAHMKLGLQLRESGYDFKADERLRIYLTNALEEARDTSSLLPFARWIAEEANAAGRVKTEVPIMVLLGNPPYSVSSVNKSDHIEKLMETYKAAVREEQNIQPLSDDYIKFIRFAQDRIERTGHGVIAMITNHTYLSGLLHRGMRHELLKAFSEIYILNLHGSALLGEQTPGGEKDENVFDIKQGVAVAVLVRNSINDDLATIKYADLWGVREVKYSFLIENDVETTRWEMLKPSSPNFFFVPVTDEYREEYSSGWVMTDIFKVHSTGFETGRDRSLMHFEQSDLVSIMLDLTDAGVSDNTISKRYGIEDTSGWPACKRRKDLIEEGFRKEFIRTVDYRPFDRRITYYHRFLRRRQFENLRHLCRSNLALITTRIIKGELPNHAFVAKNPVEKIFISPKTSNNAFVFPLFLYSDASEQATRSLFPLETSRRFLNFRPDFIAEVKRKLEPLDFLPDGPGDLKESLGPQDYFHYIYAVLHSPTYRSRYAEFLKIDFPRIPLTSDLSLFQSLCFLGSHLVGLHLMEEELSSIVNFPVTGNNSVEKIAYEEQSRVWINKNQYFEGVPPEVWEFYVGGYQVCHKWLKDRKGRKLSFDDLTHYQKIVSALAETIRIMGEIDAVIEDHGGFPIR